MNEDHRPIQSQPSGFPSTITVNVVVSGHVVLEVLSTVQTDVAKLAALTEKLKAPTENLQSAIDTNIVPTP